MKPWQRDVLCYLAGLIAGCACVLVSVHFMRILWGSAPLLTAGNRGYAFMAWCICIALFGGACVQAAITGLRCIFALFNLIRRRAS